MANNKFKFNQPYSTATLDPLFTPEALECHFFHAHRYATKLNAITSNGEMYPHADTVQQLYDTLDHSNIDYDCPSIDPVYNCTSQILNHQDFFDQLSATPSEDIDDGLINMIRDKYGSLLNLKAEINRQVDAVFGSGWVWLTLEMVDHFSAFSLKIISTPGANRAQTSTGNYIEIPLIVIDVWEHAYYVDHTYKRNLYMKNFWKALDWTVVNDRFQSGIATKQDYTQPFEL